MGSKAGRRTLAAPEWGQPVNPADRARHANLRRAILVYLSKTRADLTAGQIAERFRRSPGVIRPRMTELAALGAIRDTGRRVSGGAGRPSVVWALADSPHYGQDT